MFLLLSLDLYKNMRERLLSQDITLDLAWLEEHLAITYHTLSTHLAINCYLGKGKKTARDLPGS
jgi:hypothetical protein